MKKRNYSTTHSPYPFFIVFLTLHLFFLEIPQVKLCTESRVVGTTKLDLSRKFKLSKRSQLLVVGKSEFDGILEVASIGIESRRKRRSVVVKIETSSQGDINGCRFFSHLTSSHHRHLHVRSRLHVRGKRVLLLIVHLERSSVRSIQLKPTTPANPWRNLIVLREELFLRPERLIATIASTLKDLARRSTLPFKFTDPGCKILSRKQSWHPIPFSRLRNSRRLRERLLGNPQHP